MTKLVVVGLGYVGLPMALRAAETGLDVVGLDSNADVVSRLNDGHSHIGDVAGAELAEGLVRGFRATTDPSTIETADVVVVCVPTPLSADGGPDLGSVIRAGEMIGRHITRGALVVLESTTYPGTTEEVFAPLVLGERFELGEVHIAFSPERIDPGNQVWGVQNTPKVVGGLTEASTRAAQAFYSGFIDTVVAARGTKEAEMAKRIENTFRHVNIALVNEMVRFCDELDIDLWDAIDCAETKPFGFMAFRPGPGVGGHCIPVDPSYLSHRVKARLGYSFRMVELAEEINVAAPLYVAERVRLLLNTQRKAVNGAKVLLLGITYKADIADRRESPADPLARRLLTWGADVAYHDEYAPTWDLGSPTGPVRLQSVTDLADATTGADIVVLLQNHRNYDLTALTAIARQFLDTRGVVQDGAGVHRL